jgi:tartrate dehydratase alpha subunit/fumarate hydratase class I-like protein
MKTIINNMQGVFVKTNYLYRNDVLSDMEYIGQENDKKNIKKDITNLLFDLKLSVKEANLRWQNNNSTQE